jgi:hypothetical protein
MGSAKHPDVPFNFPTGMKMKHNLGGNAFSLFEKNPGVPHRESSPFQPKSIYLFVCIPPQGVLPCLAREFSLQTLYFNIVLK